MSYFDEEQMYRDIIMDHVKNPRNKKRVTCCYKNNHLKNPSCGDELTLYILFDDNNKTIKDVSYKVSGCSICCSSVSMMSELLIGKTLKETKEIIENFNNMITGSEYDEKLLGDAISLKGIINVPPRIKCATLGYQALNEMLSDQDER